MTTWAPVFMDPALPKEATVFGRMLDHIWAQNGQPGEIELNIARRTDWPEDMYISVLPAIDADPDGEKGPLWDVFFDNELPYVITDEAEHATDWLIASLD